MWTFIALLARVRNADRQTQAADNGHFQEQPAQRLFEAAGGRIGLDSHQAQELRRAASAYLSVVR